MHRGGDNETILLVEDDRSMLDIISSTLTVYGYNVVTANNGLQQVKQRVNEIRLIISDVVMPSMSGLDLYKEIRRLDVNIKVLFITGYGSETMLVKKVTRNGDRGPVKTISAGKSKKSGRCSIENV